MAGTSVQKIIDIVLRVVDETKGVIKKTSSNLKAVDSRTKEVNVTSKGAAATVKKLGDSFRGTSKEADQSAKAMGRADTASKKFAKTPLTKTLTTLKSNLTQIQGTLKSYVGTLGKAIAKNRSFTQSTDQMKRSTGGVQTNLSGMMAALTGFVATAGSLIFPVTKAAQFQRAMSEVQAISGATDEQLAGLTTRAAELGRTTEYTGVQSAEAMKMLAMAGLNVEQIFEAVGSTLQVAHAGAVDLGVAADIVTNIMTGFRLEAKDLTRVNDVLVQTFTHTNSTLQDLGFAMAYVAPVAAGLGADFEDLTATVGALHNAGLKGTMAGTSLRGMLYRLFNPTKEEAELIQTLNDRIGDMGLQIRDTSGKFVGFVNLIDQLERSNMDAAEAMALFGQRAGPGMAALLGMGSKALAEYVQLNKEAEGRAETISKVMGQNVTGAYRRAKSAVDALSISIGDRLSPATEKFLDLIAAVAQGLETWGADNQTLSTGIIRVVAGVAALVGAIGLWKLAVLALGPAFKALIGGLMSFLGVLAAGTISTTAFFAAIAAFIAFLAGIAFSDTFREWIGDFNVFGASIETWTKRTYAKLSKFWSLVKAGFRETWLDVKEALGFDVTEARKALDAQLEKELDLLNEESQAIEKRNALEQATSDLQDKIKEKAKKQQDAINAVTKEYQGIIKKVRDAWTEAGTKVTNFRTEITNLTTMANERLNALSNSIGTSISEGFARINTGPAVRQLQVKLREIEREYDKTDTYRKNRAVEVENEISKTRVDIIARTVQASEAAWEGYATRRKSILDASLQAQIITQREYTQSVKDLEMEVTEAKRAAYAKARDALQTELDKSLSAEKAYADQIKSIQEDIAGFHKTTDEKIRELLRKGMSDQAAYYDKVKELQEKLATASSLKPDQYEKAKALFKEVQSAASGLVGEIKKGDKVLISEKTTIAQAIEILKQADAGLAKSGKAAQTEAQERLDHQKTVTQNLMDTLDQLANKFDLLSLKLSQVLQVKVGADTTEVDKAIAKLEGVEDTPGLLEHYQKQKEELDKLSKRLGELELEFARAKKAATLKVSTQFDPEIEQLKEKVKSLGGTVKEEKETMERPVKLKADTTAVKQGVEQIKQEVQGIPVNVSTAMSIKEIQKLAAELHKVQEETGRPLEFTGISAATMETSIANIGRLKAELKSIEEQTKQPQKVEVASEGEEEVEDLSEAIDEVKDKEVTAKADVAGTSAVKGLGDAIASLHNKTITITARYVTEGAPVAAATGGLMTSAPWTPPDTGRKVPGVGTGDSVLAMLAPKEYVLCADAVKTYGLDFIQSINRRMLKLGGLAGGPIPKFASGGPVGNVGLLTNSFIEFFKQASDMMKRSLGSFPSITKIPSIRSGGMTQSQPEGRYRFDINIGGATLSGMSTKPLLEQFKMELRRLEMARGL